MVHQVLPNGIVPIHGKGDLEFGPHPINAGNKHRLFIFFNIEGEQASESTDLAEHLGAVG